MERDFKKQNKFDILLNEAYLKSVLTKIIHHKSKKNKC